MDATDSNEVMTQVGALLERRRLDQARALLKPALENQPDHLGLVLQSAWLEFLDDSPGVAMQSVRHVLAAEPQNASARFLYFRLVTELENYAEAERAIIGLLGDFPEEAQYYGCYADVMLRTLHFDKALRLAREGLRYDPDDIACLTTQTLCEFIAHPTSRSNQGLQRLMVQDPQSTHTIRLVVVALVQGGDYSGARRLSQELVRHDPKSESIVELARTLRIEDHWSMLPLWPLRRYGWGASAILWLAGVLGTRALSDVNPTVAAVYVTAFLIYVVYSWVWPPLLRRLVGT
jgi:tetratricopeptide (TPR) repeat protein